MGANTLFGCIFKVNQCNLWGINVPCVAKELLNKLRSAFANAHCTHCSVTGVAVRAKEHISAFCHHFTGILMDNSLVCRNIDSAVFFCCGKAENMVILIDCSTDSAKAVVAVGQCIRNGELPESACSCGLNDSDIGDVVGDERIKTNLHFLFVFFNAVGIED